MKKPFILCCITLLAIAPVCFTQGKPVKAGKSATKEATIVNLEKAVTEAFKNKQAEAFRKYLAPGFVSIDAEGIKNVDAEVVEMGKYDVRENSVFRYEGSFQQSQSCGDYVQGDDASHARRAGQFRNI